MSHGVIILSDDQQIEPTPRYDMFPVKVNTAQSFFNQESNRMVQTVHISYCAVNFHACVFKQVFSRCFACLGQVSHYDKLRMHTVEV